MGVVYMSLSKYCGDIPISNQFGGNMTKNISILCIVLLILFCLPGQEAEANEGQGLTVAEIIAKNIEAVGGKEKIESIKNVTFDAVNPNYPQVINKYSASSDGRLRIETNINGLVPAIVILNNGEIKTVQFSNTQELSPLEKVNIKCFNNLYTGAFSLMNFKDILTFQGMKKFGPEKYYLLTTTIDNHSVTFYIDTKEFILKRVVFKGSSKEDGKYESAYEFGPAQDADGLKVPSSRFGTNVGTGNTYSGQSMISNFKINQPLDDKFFDKQELNFGSVTAIENLIKGNGIFSQAIPGRYTVVLTNYSAADLEKSKLKSQDRIRIKIGESEFDGHYLSSDQEIATEHTSPGSAILLRQEDGYAVFLLFGDNFSPINEKFKPLVEITVTKIKDKEEK